MESLLHCLHRIVFHTCCASTATCHAYLHGRGRFQSLAFSCRLVLTLLSQACNSQLPLRPHRPLSLRVPAASLLDLIPAGVRMHI